VALVAGWMGAAVLTASPASADVNCADLGSRTAAQTYYDGHPGNADHLDGDGDGKACESSAPHADGTWTLVVLGVLLAAGLLRYTTFAKDKGERSEARTLRPAEPVVAVETVEAEEPARVELAAVAAPVLVEQLAIGSVTFVQDRQSVVRVAVSGSVGELARALRMVRYSERMGVLEAHAAAHDSSPRDVLAALAESTSDLELQGWALAGYDPPWTVRVMRCDCVDGLRNFQLKTAEDGSHYWCCSTCHQPVHSAS
jgi:hypothetical protein